MIKPILTQDDEFSVLRKPCIPVEYFDRSLWDLVEDLWDTMYAANGLGLAATQIGARLRVAVIDTIRRSSSNRRLVLVNPRILGSSGQQIMPEGCLSMPGLQWPIPRAASVYVEFQGLNGRLQSLRTRDLLARAIQHECDHLNGILCNSRAPAEKESDEPAKERVLVIGK